MISFNVQVRDFPFNESSQGLIESWKSEDKEYGSNWPVVYLIHNDDTKEAYVGETLNAGKRAWQHWQTEERKRLKTIHIMTDDSFNKSVILDLESFLIKYLSADGIYKLQNGNNGLANFNYYSRHDYEQQFQKIWDKLKELGLVQSGIADIEDSDLYKYSPYKSLTADQQKVLGKILYLITGYLKQDLEETVIVEGCAGTGKTILAIFLLKLLTDLNNNSYEVDETSEATDVSEIESLIRSKKKLKIGFVVPQVSLRETIRKVFKSIRSMPDDMVMSPAEAAKRALNEPFDLLVCDEAHRLQRREALNQFKQHDQVNALLGLPQETTQLEWIIRSSHMQLLFYDPDQSVKPCDITQDMFIKLLSTQSIQRLKLSSQLRCLGGDDYIQYVKEVLNGNGLISPSTGNQDHLIMRDADDSICNVLIPHGPFKDYTLQMYDDIDQMMDEINRLDQAEGLSCAVAGYGWKWKTKKHPNDPTIVDITIGRGYIWNRTTTDWINSGRLPNEIGCIHTVQGYDLNYVGVIFGPEIVFDKSTGRIEVLKKKYADSRGKAVGNNYEALRRYIINIYSTLLTRGIRGALVYVYDPELREYLRPYFQNKN